MSDRIEQSVELKAAPARVWRALVDHDEFGAWFHVALDGPFVVGQSTTGRLTLPGYERLKWEVTVVAIEPERRFAFTWRPYAIDPDRDYSGERPTTVEFRLQPHGEGTRLLVTESGFDGVAQARRAEAFRMNSAGWATQMQGLAAFVDG